LYFGVCKITGLDDRGPQYGYVISTVTICAIAT
jgi:hypothetical protein